MKEILPSREFNTDEEPLEAEARLAAEKAAKRIEHINEQFGPEATARLIEANVVLTLGDARGQTEFFIDYPTEKELEKFKEISKAVQNEGIRFRIGKEFPAAFDQRPTVRISLESLEGLARVSRESHIPGISPYDPQTGWKGHEEWIKESKKKLGEASKTHELPAEFSREMLDHILIGVIKGYPDQAILDIALAGKQKIPRSDWAQSEVAYADLYGGAEPNYHYLPEHANNSSILSHTKLWGEILKEFYASSFHKKIEQHPTFKNMRANMDKEQQERVAKKRKK